MEPTDGTEVHVVLPPPAGQQKTKAAAALQASQPAPDHHEQATWQADDATQPDKPTWSSKTLWVLFALGWIIAPCWWAGVAAGLTKDSPCLLRRRRGLKPAQMSAWYAHVAMTIISTVLVVLVCSIHLTRKSDAEYTQTYFLAMSGPEEAFTSLNDPANMRTVADTLHDALDLSESYSPNNIKVWLESSETVTPTTSRHLLGSTKRVLLAYAFAKQSNLPDATKLTEMVGDASMGTKLVQGLADADLLPDELVEQIVAISIVADNADAAVSLFVESKGEMVAGPFFLLMASRTEPDLPDLTNTTILKKVAEGLHSAWRLPVAYTTSNINVTVDAEWTWQSQKVVVLKYSFKENVLLTAQGLAELAADRSTMAFTQALTDLAFVSPTNAKDQSYQDTVVARLSAARTLDDASIQLRSLRFTLFDTMIPVGKFDCAYSLVCDTATQGTTGKAIVTAVHREAFNGGKACPTSGEACTAPVHCQGAWSKHNCTARCTTEGPQQAAVWNEVYTVTQQPKDGSHGMLAFTCDEPDGTIMPSKVPCDALDCTCNGTWSNFSPCTGACGDQKAVQTRTFSKPVAVNTESTVTRHLLAEACPAHGATHNVTCSLPCPKNCSLEWQPLDMSNPTKDCNATCGQTTCLAVRVVLDYGSPQGICDITDKPGRLEQFQEDGGTCFKGCVGSPAPWLSAAGLAKPDAKGWACNGQVNGLTPSGRSCYGTCVEGSVGEAVVRCSDGVYTPDLSRSRCVPADPSVDFANTQGSLLWTGLTEKDESAGKCNGTDVPNLVANMISYATTNGGAPGSPSQKGRAVFFEAQKGSTNATATLEAINATATPLSLKSFFVLSLKHAATLSVSVQQGNSTAILVKTMTLTPQAWTYVNTASVPQLQQASKIILHAEVGAPSCAADEAPVIVLGGVNV